MIDDAIRIPHQLSIVGVILRAPVRHFYYETTVQS